MLDSRSLYESVLGISESHEKAGRVGRIMSSSYLGRAILSLSKKKVGRPSRIKYTKSYVR